MGSLATGCACSLAGHWGFGMRTSSAATLRQQPSPIWISTCGDKRPASTVEAAQALLSLRAVYLNGDWKPFIEYRIQQEQAEIYPYTLSLAA